MPMHTGYVRGVVQKETAAGKTVFDVFLADAPDQVWRQIVRTDSAWKASLCDQARKAGQVITVGTRETRFGEELVTVDGKACAA